MPLHYDIDLKNFIDIQEYFSKYVNKDLIGQSITVFDKTDNDIIWLQEKIIDDIFGIFLEDPKIKICVLGGLSGNESLRVHMDGHNPPTPEQHWALNIPIFNCEDTKMYWYDNNYNIGYATPTNKPNLPADDSQHLRPIWIGNPKVIDECSIDKPKFVKVTTPHSVTNFSKRPRYLLSVRFNIATNL